MPSRFRRQLAPLACTAALLALPVLGAGCGPTAEEKVRDTVDAYVDAVKDEDYGEVCDLFDAAFRAEQGLGKNCPKTLASQDSGLPKGDSEIVSVQVRQGKATVDLDVTQSGEAPSRRTISLVRRDGEWKVNGTT